MADISFAQRGDSVVVRSEYWQVEHRASVGGCWSSIKFKNGSGKNLLAGPPTSRIRTNRILGYNDPESPIVPSFEERLDKQAGLSVKEIPNGIAVTAKGMYRDESGADTGVRFRRRYEYREFGLVAVTLEVIADRELGGMIEFDVFDMQLRAGLTHTYIRRHPATNPQNDLRGGYAWSELTPSAKVFRDRYMPIHVVCFEKGVEGLDFYPASDLTEWDTSLTPSEGLGQYILNVGADGKTYILLSPYCMGFRRVPITLSGTKTFHMYFGLPFVKPADSVGIPYFECGINSRWPSDQQLQRQAAAGIRLIRFHNDYREDGPFWHDGQYPPYDAAGMKELRRVIDTCHRLGMKIVPYMSLKELHPEAPGYAEHAEEWTQAIAPTSREIHTWLYTGEFGRLMCMKSGWLDRRKADVETILSDLPWDGLYFDWTTPLPCCHEGHAAGRYHTDTDEYLDFLFFCRRRIGTDGVLYLHLSGHPYVTAENMADAAIIYEDVGGVYPEPDQFPVHCPFMPIVPRFLATGARGGTVDSRKLIMSSFLEGYSTPLAPVADDYSPAQVPRGDLYHQEMLAEVGLFEAANLAEFRLKRATDGAVKTGNDKVYAAIWHRRGKAMVYVGNFTGKTARGVLRFDPALAALAGGKGALAGRILRPDGKSKAFALTAAAIKTKGIPYSLAPWQSLMVHLERS